MMLRAVHLLHVPGMMCGDCVVAIGRALRDIDRGLRMEADLATRRIRIASPRLESLLRALRRSGFPAEPVLRPLG
jgi:copper chaperone